MDYYILAEVYGRKRKLKVQANSYEEAKNKIIRRIKKGLDEADLKDAEKKKCLDTIYIDGVRQNNLQEVGILIFAAMCFITGFVIWLIK